MTRIDVADFEITDRAIEKALWHSIGTDQLYAVLDHVSVVIRNRGERTASHILIGADDQGRCIAIPISPTRTL